MGTERREGIQSEERVKSQLRAGLRDWGNSDMGRASLVEEGFSEGAPGWKIKVRTGGDRPGRGKLGEGLRRPLMLQERHGCVSRQNSCWKWKRKAGKRLCGCGVGLGETSQGHKSGGGRGCHKVNEWGNGRQLGLTTGTISLFSTPWRCWAKKTGCHWTKWGGEAWLSDPWVEKPAALGPADSSKGRQALRWEEEMEGTHLGK